MIDEILNSAVKTASEFVGGTFGFNNDERRENITNKTECFLNSVLNDFKAVFDDMEKDLDIIFCEKHKKQY